MYCLDHASSEDEWTNIRTAGGVVYGVVHSGADPESSAVCSLGSFR